MDKWEKKRQKYIDYCKKHFNELGIYGGFEICRLIGFAEDEDDYYYVTIVSELRNPDSETPVRTMWHSMVGGWYSCKPMGKRAYDYMEANAIYYIPKSDEFQLIAEK